MINIKVIEKNEGEKIPYSVTETKITFGEDELTVNIQSRERDYDMSIDICKDSDGCLTVGVGATTKNYVAQVDVPARAYEDVEDGTDEEGNIIIRKVPVDFDMEKCTLTLWKNEEY